MTVALIGLDISAMVVTSWYAVASLVRRVTLGLKSKNGSTRRCQTSSTKKKCVLPKKALSIFKAWPPNG
jgi:hypothetical protein